MIEAMSICLSHLFRKCASSRLCLQDLQIAMRILVQFGISWWLSRKSWHQLRSMTYPTPPSPYNATMSERLKLSEMLSYKSWRPKSVSAWLADRIFDNVFCGFELSLKLPVVDCGVKQRHEASEIMLRNSSDLSIGSPLLVCDSIFFCARTYGLCFIWWS